MKKTKSQKIVADACGHWYPPEGGPAQEHYDDLEKVVGHILTFHQRNLGPSYASCVMSAVRRAIEETIPRSVADPGQTSDTEE